jgi:hypothetical protein
MRLGGSGGPEVYLPPQGEGQPGNEIVAEGPVNPQDAGAVTVPYSEVFSPYRDVAYSAVEGGEYPKSLEGIVHSYFQSLEP